MYPFSIYIREFRYASDDTCNPQTNPQSGDPCLRLPNDVIGNESLATGHWQPVTDQQEGNSRLQ
jgi:hypothetical protein